MKLITKLKRDQKRFINSKFKCTTSLSGSVIPHKVYVNDIWNRFCLALFHVPKYQRNECVKNPCKNGATCINTQGSYQCKCELGFNGKQCEHGKLCATQYFVIENYRFVGTCVLFSTVN